MAGRDVVDFFLGVGTHDGDADGDLGHAVMFGGPKGLAILADDIVVDAFAEIRNRQLKAFENSAPGDTGAREQAYHMLIAIRQLEAELRSSMDAFAMKKGRDRDSD